MFHGYGKQFRNDTNLKRRLAVQLLAAWLA
jgi:hypothetical protein